MGEGIAGKSVREMREAGLLSDEGRTARGPIPPHHREYVLNVMGAVEALKAGLEPAGISAIVRTEAQRIVDGGQPPYFLDPVREKVAAPEKRPAAPKRPKGPSKAALLRTARLLRAARRNHAEADDAMGRGVVRCAQCQVATKPNSAGPVFCCLICVGSRVPTNDELYCCAECLGRHVSEKHRGKERRAA